MARRPIRRLRLDGHVAHLRGRWVVRTVVGTVFLGLGTLLAAHHDTLDVRSAETGKPVSELGVLAVAGFVGLVGLLLASYRSGIRLDRSRPAVESWWGFGPLRRTRRQALGEWVAVRARKVVSRGNGGSSTSYPVDLVGRESGTTLHLLRGSSAVDARAAGEEVARFMGLPLRESVAGTETERSAEHLDRTFREAVLAEGERPPYPVLPLASKVLAEHKGSRWIVSFPPPGALRSGLGIALLLLPPTGLFLAMAWAMIGDSFAEFLPWITALTLLPHAGFALSSLVRGSCRQTLEILPGSITVESRRPGGLRKVERMSWDELEQVVVHEAPTTPLSGVVGGGEVTLVADDRWITVGRAGRPEDRVFLVSLLRHALTEPLDGDTLSATSGTRWQPAGRSGDV